MHNFIILGVRLGNAGGLTWSWYDILFGGLAAVVVFSDKIIACISKLIGRELGWRWIAWLVGIALGLIIIATLVLMRFYPDLDWWYPLIFIGLCMLLQVLFRVISKLDDLGFIRRRDR